MTAIPYHRADRTKDKHPEALAVELTGLERHYQAEARRLAAESEQARVAAASCREWRANLNGVGKPAGSR